ncbi:MAG: arginine:agmatin antiporter [Methanosaeta sp. PtaU1.Bin060]|nr:MAG: arginine:agmatin antiporter [Methanosaeta sp. PtaU1.Bin060]
MSNGKSKALGVFALAMINVAAVLSLRNCPSMAIYGWSSIGWYLIGTIAFFIPLTLAGAELATGWPLGGGVYAWVREAFGEEAGFVAVFCEWSNNLVWFPTVLAFIASTFAYFLNPALANDNKFMFVVMMVAFWGTTIISLLGERTSSRFGSFGVVAGTIIPATFIIVLGLAYWFSGDPISLPPFSLSATLPDINISTLPFIAVVVLLFAGMEMAGFHALEVKNPQKDYPKAMALSAILIFVLAVATTLAIAIVVPVNQLSLAAGLMQAFQSFLQSFNLTWVVAPLALLVALGGLATLASWLAGPALGLGAVAAKGNMPPFFARTNKNGAPTGVLILQAVIGTVVSMLYLFVPSISTTYWILSAMTVLLLCIVYMLMFAALIKLRYSQPGTPRAFKIPGGIAGIWVTGGTGFIACMFTFLVSLIPPANYEHMSVLAYAMIMLIGTAILALPPLVFLRLKKPSWNIQPKKEVQG